MRSLIAGLALALLVVVPVSANPNAASLSLDGPAAYNTQLTVTVVAKGREAYLRSLWVTIQCVADDGGSYIEHGAVGWRLVMDDNHSGHSVVGPFVMASGVPTVQPGSVGGTSVGDWDGGPADCEAWVWSSDHGMDPVSEVLAFHAAG